MVVFCEGDLFFYGFFMYIYICVKDVVFVEVVFVIIGMFGVWIVIGVLIIWGDDVLIVIMGMYFEEKLVEYIWLIDVFVIMKIGMNFDKVVWVLKVGGKYDDVYLV